MTVAQVGYRDYWTFLTRVEVLWEWFPDDVVSIKQPDHFDVASMMQKVVTASLQERVVIQEDKRCVVDQLVILDTPSLSGLLRVACAVEQFMRNTAIGSALLTGLVIRSFMMEKNRYVISVIGCLAMTGFVFVRYLQAKGLVRSMQKKINEEGTAVAHLRKEYYALGDLSKIQEGKCLYPFEGEGLFKYDFSKWANNQLAQKPSTPEEKARWVQGMLEEGLGLQYMRVQKLLVEGCIEPSTLVRTLVPVFRTWGKFRDFFKNREAASRAHRIALLQEQDNITKFLGAFLPAIVGVFDQRERVRKNASWAGTEPQTMRKNDEEYFYLACSAATEGTLLEEAIRSLSVVRTHFCLESFYYDEARLFLEAGLSIVEKGEGKMPEVKDIFKVPRSQGSLQGLSIPLDTAFYGRAKKRVPACGTPEEYEKFLQEVLCVESLKKN